MQQGNPLGPMLYALEIGELMADLSNKLSLWTKEASDGDEKEPTAPLALLYWDDGVFVAKHAVLSPFLDLFDVLSLGHMC